MKRRRLHILSLSVAGAMVLGACSASDAVESASAAKATTTTVVAVTSAPPTTAVTGTTHAADSTTTTTAAEAAGPSCDWDSGRLTSADTSDAPASEGDDLAQSILGSWQHTHIDSGAGFEAVSPTTDIRFVLSPDRFLYCQDVEGATNQSEISAPLILEGVEIVLPSPASGYAVTAWDETTMVWLNHFDGSFYLLQRR